MRELTHYPVAVPISYNAAVQVGQLADSGLVANLKAQRAKILTESAIALASSA